MDRAYVLCWNRTPLDIIRANIARQLRVRIHHDQNIFGSRCLGYSRDGMCHHGKGKRSLQSPEIHHSADVIIEFHSSATTVCRYVKDGGTPPMDLDQLHTFLEIVRLKSFSKAAQTCFRTQPAISAQVRQLEQELNTTLFERLGTKISLTTAGKIFAEYAEQILDLRRRAQDTINEQ